jgi:nucleoside-diphosphate-sugar epimerase
MQTILGSNGVIGLGLAKALTAYTDQIRLVSRTPTKVNVGDALFAADLMDEAQNLKAVEGSDIVYMTIGLPYTKKIWSTQWPIAMRNIINACRKHQAKMVFFDNVYMYGEVHEPMTEQTPFNTQSVKGKARAFIANELLQQMQAGNLEALIARAPEFYGAGKTMSVINNVVLDALRDGKKPRWPVDDTKRKTFIYTPDASAATALLGNTPDAYQQTWHLPCSNEVITGQDFMRMLSIAVGNKVPYDILTKWMIKIGGLFNPLVREVIEMLYQFENDYDFNSDKFKLRFPDFPITSYQDGLNAVVASWKK